MFWTIAMVSGVVWLLGLINGVTLDGFIHVLLVAALTSGLIRVSHYRRLLRAPVAKYPRSDIYD